MYGLAPLQYRKWGVFIPLNEKADLMKIYQEELKRGITMQPVIKEKNEFYVVGIELGRLKMPIWRTIFCSIFGPWKD